MPSYTVGTVLSALSTAPLVVLPLMITYSRSEEKDEMAKVGGIT